MSTAPAPTHRVLVVDDSEQMTALVASWLADLAVVSVAYSAEEAWQIAAASRPHLVVVDIVMPRHSGFDFVEALRQQPGGDQSQVIFMTGLQEPANTYRAMELGALMVLHKPLEAEHVRQVVAAALQTHGAANP